MIGHPSEFHRLFDLPDSGVRAMSSLRVGGRAGRLFLVLIWQIMWAMTPIVLPVIAKR